MIIDVIRKMGQPLRERTLILGLVLISFSLLQISCESRRAVSGVLVIGVEGLKPEDIQCTPGQESEFRGFNFLCHEFVRLQGMVANSSSSAANVASLLTREPPEKHGLRTNDAFLSSSLVLLPEKLSARNWKTGLISGSPPISRRTNLSQGFETFDESNPLAPKMPFRGFEQIASSAIGWLTESDTKKFFLFLSMSDLLFPEFATVSDKGEDRPRSVEGQLEEFDETLFHFFEDLKHRNLWDKMWIVVVGLSGRVEHADPTVPIAITLTPAHLQVPVFIKGRGQSLPADELIKGAWSHVQLGQFLDELVSELDKKSPSDGTWPESKQALLDHSVPFIGTEACLRGDQGLICRQAFFDQTTWLNWESPLRLESSSRRELMQKVRDGLLQQDPANEKFEPPPRLGKDLTVKRPMLPPWKDCLESFEDTSLSARMNNCASKSAQILRNLILIRKSVEGRPESLKDERLRFLHDWSQLRAAGQLYDKFAPTRLFADLHTRPIEEFKTLEKILERPELSDVRREALRVNGK